MAPEARLAFAGRLRSLAEAIGTQPQAAEVAGVSLAQLKNYLSGSSAPSFPAVARLAQAARVELEWVFTGSGKREREGPSFGESMRYAQRTKLKVNTAEEIGKAVARAYSVRELPEPVDDAIGRLAELLVDAVGNDDAARVELIERIVALVRAAHDSSG